MMSCGRPRADRLATQVDAAQAGEGGSRLLQEAESYSLENSPQTPSHELLETLQHQGEQRRHHVEACRHRLHGCISRQTTPELK